MNCGKPKTNPYRHSWNLTLGGLSDTGEQESLFDWRNQDSGRVSPEYLLCEKLRKLR